MKPLFHFKWATFEERMDEYRRNAFCRTFGHARAEQRGLRKSVCLCPRCRHGVTP